MSQSEYALLEDLEAKMQPYFSGAERARGLLEVRTNNG